MRRKPLATRRRGNILPLVAVCLIGLMGLVALAIDIGLIAVARTQTQNAADSAAMAGARTITGDADATVPYNYDAVPGAAITAAKANSIVGQAVTGDPNENWAPKDPDGNPDPVATAKVHPNDYTYKTGQVTVEVGSYIYTYNDADPSQEKFSLKFPRPDDSEPYSAVRATVAGQGNFMFARVFGLTTFNTTAKATAVHRPRDVVIIMDLSGSMRFQSLPGIPRSGIRTTSMNPETVYPRFGQYSATGSAALQGTASIPSGGGETFDPANISVTTDAGATIIEDFFKHNAGTTPNIPADRAFTRAPDSYETAPGGDNFLRTGGDASGNPYAATVKEVVGGTAKDLAFETNGYDEYRSTSPFKGYTQGPGYWGKTFLVWPPDPRGPAAATSDPTNSANYADNGARDWRQRFFFKYNTDTGTLGWLDHNNIMWETSSGGTYTIKKPQTTTDVTEIVNGVPQTGVTYNWRINYAAILHWLRQSPAPFPSQIRAGRIKYYDAIPDPTADTGLNNRWWTTQTLSNLNERFWRAYIDFVLGLEVSGTSNGVVTYRRDRSSKPLSGMIGNGDYYVWGAFQVKQKPDPSTMPTKAPTGGKLASSPAKGSLSLSLSGLSAAPTAGDTVCITTGGVKYYYTLANSPAPTKTSIQLTSGLVVAGAENDAVAFLEPAPYMDYQDNPKRAKHQFWFGPMTWVDWLGNYNTDQFWWPGNVHEAQAWACKVGIQSAIDDIKKNHPSDFIGLAYFSTPSYARSDGGHHNAPSVPLGRNYQQLKDFLWFPPTTVVGGATEITPYSGDMDNVPRANGGTCPTMGFMIAYNLFSSGPSLRGYPQPQGTYRGAIGGLGRNGASRLIIFETDGAPNTGARATLEGSGSDRYYKIRVTNPGDLNDKANVEWPSNPGYSVTDLYNVVDQICVDVSQGGYSTKRKPAQIHCIAYGSLYDAANTSQERKDALGVLQTIQKKGNSATTTAWSDFPAIQQIYGTNDQRISRMQSAFSSIMQAGVQVSLIE